MTAWSKPEVFLTGRFPCSTATGSHQEYCRRTPTASRPYRTAVAPFVRGVLTALMIAPPVIAGALPLADFEWSTDRITLSEGREFPGARGRFERAETAARSGGFGGRLHFDFSAGGHYVALVFEPDHPADTLLDQANALEGWVRRPAGHDLLLRYTDATGQTFQRPIESKAGDWTRIVAPFIGWTSHWGGANDGQVRGGPVRLALLIEAGADMSGHLDLDDLRLVRQETTNVRVRFAAYRFLASEGWNLRAHGPPGNSRLTGRFLHLDFSQGADAFSLVPPDRVLFGTVEQLWLRVYGSVRPMPVSVVLRTHFMNFHRQLGILEGDGHLELSTAGPPGPDWGWSGGENDGQLHGPLRLGEIRFERPKSSEVVKLELEEILVESSAPPNKRCLAHAEVLDSPSGPDFLFSVRTLTDEAIPAVVRWQLRDWEGHRLAEGRRDIDLARQAEPVQFTMPVPAAERERLQFIEAEFELEAHDQETAPVHTAWVAPLDGEGDPQLQSESPFGIGAYFYRYPDHPAGWAEMRRAAKVAQTAGVKWSREEFQWARIEPRRGEFQWDFYDRMLAIAQEHGIQVYAIVAYWSTWTRPYTTEGIDDYVRYLEALVRRYGHDIRQWEIWNEPNIFFWQGPKDLYADLLKKSYAAIKAIDPEAEVLGLSTAGIDFDYIERMLELETPFDILTIHPYRRTLNDQAFLNDLLRVSDLVRRPDGTRRPVWLTELGWPTYSPHNTLRQNGDDPFYFEHQMGIVDRQFRPKPAYRAYALLTRILRDLKPDGALEVEDQTLACAFTEKDRKTPRRVLVLWNPQRDAQPLVPVRTDSVQRLNTVGETTWLEASDGRVQVPLRRGAPVYLLEAAP